MLKLTLSFLFISLLCSLAFGRVIDDGMED